ncbi:hypothetical protein [Pseudomonas typographi]|uniref:Uncharacterized protein n=1 Tax=Pseudomonas typographi TaxID=2715964 RepID=A0ABR7YY67_9PSED|nr:hypothetical protein [Pseudomonas typographi]MBD1598120.1 hypothetical protein [Pseudomonas typographi]
MADLAWEMWIQPVVDIQAQIAEELRKRGLAKTEYTEGSYRGQDPRP